MRAPELAPLEVVDLSLRLDAGTYGESLRELQSRARRLAYGLYEARRSLIVVLEGWDAAGKGGAIRRFTEYLDPRGYQVFPIAVPRGDSALHQYLWRFWRRLEPPHEKQIQIFDRSWYGRVLVERVEGFATEEEWSRAYREINEFERQLTDADMTVVKFWVHISEEEQLRRFERRQHTAHKKWKLTDEDWRNRERWKDYERAVNDMVVRTGTDQAPWTIVAGEDKCYARVEILRVLNEAMERALASVAPTDAESSS